METTPRGPIITIEQNPQSRKPTLHIKQRLQLLSNVYNSFSVEISSKLKLFQMWKDQTG